jgi:cytoskeletal protein RodZ
MRARNSNIGSEPNINLARCNMENLDDLMRKKFNTAEEAGRYEFQEQYWDQARALIEADERKRKRRRMLLWWWFGGIFILSMAGIYGVINSKKVEHASAKTTNTGRYTEQSGQKSEEADNTPNAPLTQTETLENQIENKTTTDNKSSVFQDAATTSQSAKSGNITFRSANATQLKSPDQTSAQTPSYAQNNSLNAKIKNDQQNINPENNPTQEVTKDIPL